LQDISRALKSLPKDLNETYERILQDIPDEKWKYAHRIFQCLTVSFRQLRIDELAEIFVIEVDTEPTQIPGFNSDCRDRDAEGAVQSACPSLVAVVDIDGDQIAQFSHFSVQEFLVSQSLEDSQHQRLSKYHVHPLSAHAFFAKACLCVLLHLGNDVDNAKIKNSPLASYAAKHWVDHAKLGCVSSDIQAGLMMKRLFDKALPHFKTWVRLYNVDTRPPESTTHPREPEPGPLYYAALCGFPETAKHLIDAHPEDVNARGGNHVTPLHAALYGGSREHLKIAQLLLENGADVGSRGIEDQTPLHIASDRGYKEIVEFLIDDRRADRNSVNAGRETPLTLASKAGRAVVVGVLLARGADANHKDRGGWTRLHNASQKGHDDVVRLLLDPVQAPVANVNAQDLNDNTPLHIASFHGKTAAIKILLERGATLDARDKQGGTALHDAAQGGHLEVVRLLLDHRADSRARNGIGEMPFQVASRNNHTDVAQLLREHAGE
jgi:ankyrin repeat protein